MSEIDDYFAENVRIAREAAGMSLQALADAMTESGFNFSRQTVWKVEHKERKLSLGEAVALATILEEPSIEHLFATDYAPGPRDLREAIEVAAWSEHVGIDKLEPRELRRYQQSVEYMADAYDASDA